MLKNKKILFLILVVLISIPSVFALLNSGFPLTDDGNWMVIRLSAFYENLRNGQFPVRFLTRLNNGYGYPVANFLYPGFMYIGSFIHILGFGFIASVKLILGLSLILSSVFTYFWLNKLFKKLPALVGSIIYLYLPYHLYDVYFRGSVGEVVSLAVLPFTLWQLERKNFVFVAIGIFLLIVSHNILAVMFLPIIIIYYLIRNYKEYKLFIFSIILGFGMAAFFWLPALSEQGITVFSKTSVSELSLYFVDKIDFNLLGLIYVAILIYGVINLLRKFSIREFVLLFSYLLIGFLTISNSKFLWDIFPFTNLIQFPFRLISVLIVISAFYISYLLNKLNFKSQLLLSLFFILVALFSGYSYLYPKDFQNLPESFYSTNQDTTTVKNEYMPIWVKNIPTQMYSEKIELLNSDKELDYVSQNPNRINFSLNAENKTIVKVNTIYYPGWTLEVNGKKQIIDYNNESGVISFTLNPGNNTVKLFFAETPFRMVSNIISLISIFALLIFAFIRKYKINL